LTQNQPNRLDNLEAALGRFAELTIQNVRRHDEALSRLEANAAKHDEALFRIEGAIADLTTQQQQTTRSMDALSTTVTETLLLVAEQARLHAQHRAEIEEIWRYLRYEPRNGNGRGEG